MRFEFRTRYSNALLTLPSKAKSDYTVRVIYPKRLPTTSHS